MYSSTQIAYLSRKYFIMTKIYEDAAPTATEQFANKFKELSEEAKSNETWKTAKTFAKAGMYVGLFAGGIILVGGIAQTINRTVLGNK